MAGEVGVEGRTGGPAGRPVPAQNFTEAEAPVDDTTPGISLVASPVGVEGGAAGMQAAVAATVGGLTAVTSL